MHQPITRFYSEEAVELVKLGTTIVEDVGTIDNSPPERVPHEEYVGKDLAKARLLMPLKLSRLEQRVGDIEKKLTDLSDIVSELVSVLKTAFIPKSPEDHSSQPVEDRMYISQGRSRNSDSDWVNRNN